MHGVNVESKTQGVDLEGVARLAAALGARFEGELDQVDTYFRVRHGRLKLREISHRNPDGHVLVSAELIRYERPDQSGARVSRYERTEIGDVERCRAQLESEHDVRGCVRKRRELWTLDSTRIHLDRVESLGDFVELETVSAGAAGPDGRREHDRIASALGLDPTATVRGSYIDVLEPVE
ncbi:MAG: class IV adenylate cyclase [Actinobacteria bacterium]|nr:class IV adenylate cyclase [Actinomycetota bacterium]